MTTDLTTGRVSKVLVTFSVPLLLSTMLQQFYNIADSMIVGLFVGESGLAAIGAAYPITLFFVAIATGVSMGCSITVSQIFGAGRMGELKGAVVTALMAFAALGALLTGAGVLLSGPLMRLLNAKDLLFDNARSYLAIYAAGVLPMLLYNAAAGIFTGLGDSRLPLLLLMIASVLNVLLDYVAVGILHWGVAGAAWATSFSQLAAAAVAMAFLAGRVKALCPREAPARFDGGILSRIMSAAVPCILQQSCVALTHTIVQSLLNTFDTAVIAGYEAASKLHNFAYMAMNTIGSAFASFTAQCYGGGKYGRIKEGFRVANFLCFGCTAVIVLLFQLLPEQLMGLFIEADSAPLVIEAGTSFLRIISPVYLLIFFIITTGGLLRGTGQSSIFFVETVLEFIVRVVMCFVLTKALASYTGMMWAWYFGSSTGFVMCLLLTLRTYRRRLRAVE